MSFGTSTEPRRSKRTVPRRAIPRTPPTSRLVLVIAEPRPARCGPTAPITAAVIGAIVEPIPFPIITNRIASTQYGVSGWMNASPNRPADTIVSPYVIGILEPIRWAMFPAIGADTMIISVIGRNRTPASSGE